MGLKSIIQNAASIAFDITNDLAFSGVYSSKSNDVYNPTTGAISTTATTQTISFIKEEVSEYEKTSKLIAPDDIKIMVNASDFSGMPSIKDSLTFNSQTWEVINWETDPAVAVYTVYLRKS